MKIFRNVYFTKGSPKKFYKYIECELPSYFIIGRYLTYDSNTNHLWFSHANLYRSKRVPNNTSLQDLINNT